MKFETDRHERLEKHGYGKGKFIRESELSENHFMKDKPAKRLKW